jgi:DNA-binding transcriptional ArsR family regulator
MKHPSSPWTGDELVAVLATLASPHRLRVLAALGTGRCYVSELARRLGISRPLLQVHLRRLEAVGLVTSTVELAADAKARKFYEIVPFALLLTPESLAEAVPQLSTDDAEKEPE